MFAFLLWCVLFVLCWPLALLALILYPFVWLFLLPFRLLSELPSNWSAGAGARNFPPPSAPDARAVPGLTISNSTTGGQREESVSRCELV